MTFHGRARFVVLAALSALYFLLMTGTFNALGVVLPSMVAALSWSWASAGFGFTLLGLACGLSSLLPALAIRRFGVARTLLVGGALLAAGFVCFAVTRSVLVYHVGAVLLGVGFTFAGTVPAVHVISGTFDRRSTALGIYFTVGGMGSVAGPLLFRLSEHVLDDWRPYWLLCALASLIVAGFAALVTRRGVPDDDAALPDSIHIAPTGWLARRALLTPQFYIIVGAYTTFLLVNTTVHSFAPQHLQERGFTADGAAFVISAAAFIGAIGSIFAGIVGEKVSAQQVTLFSLMAIIVGTLGLGFATGWLGVGLFIMGMGIGLGFSYVASAMLLLSYFGKRANLELYSIMQLISTSAAIGPGVGGMVRDATGSFALVFVACASATFVIFLLTMVMRRPQEFAAAEPALAPSR